MVRHRRSRSGVAAALVALAALLLPPATAGASSPTTAAGTAAPSEAPTLDAPTLDAPAVDRVVEQYRAATGVPGLAVAVTHGRRVVRAAGYGRTADGAPVTARTPMAIASVSKSMTALAVVTLAEAGRLRLDDPVRAHLPEFALADPRGEAITVRQLLAQTSGLSDAVFPGTSGAQPATLAEAVAQLRTVHPAADPGTTWHYFNPNYAVAARLVEVVSGEPFAAFMDRHVFAPLGMADTRTVDSERDMPASAHGHLLLAGTAVEAPEPHGFAAGSGGVVTTADDLASWLVAQTDGGGVVSSAGLAALRTPSATSSASSAPSASRASYALGWEVGSTRSGTPLLSHSGALFTATAHQAVLPTSGWGVAVAANTGMATADADRLADALVALVDGQPPVPPPDRGGTDVRDGALLVLALVAVAAGVVGATRSGRWAERVRGRPWRAAAPLVLLAVPPVVALLLGPITGAVLARDVGTSQVLYVDPAPTLLLLGAAVGATALGLARVLRLLVPG